MFLTFLSSQIAHFTFINYPLIKFLVFSNWYFRHDSIILQYLLVLACENMLLIND